MNRNPLRRLVPILLLASVCLHSLWDAAAQQRSTTRSSSSRSSSSGRSSSGSGGSRDYQNNTMVGDAIISSDPETRRLIVITDDETSQYIAQVVTNLDRPRPQVLIKVVFLEVTYRNGLDFGIEGTFRKNLGNNMTGAVSNIFGLASTGATATSPAGMYQLLGNDFSATLRAIAQAGKTEVLSRPSVMARNNQQATITIGQEVPFITNTRITDQNATINTIQYQDIGIILNVTPFITSDGMVEMIVAPEISTLTDQTVPISAGVDARVIAKRSADTVVVTPNGQTIVIGGLMENNQTDSETKIPILGDIPLLGNAFKRKVKENTKTELIIFLTPHIVSTPGDAASVTANERANTQMVPKSFSEEELNRFLDTVPIKPSTATPASTPAKKKKSK